jgi:hypothetical protein
VPEFPRSWHYQNHLVLHPGERYYPTNQQPFDFSNPVSSSDALPAPQSGLR